MNNHQKEQQLEEQHLAQCLKIIQQNIHLYEDKESQYKKSPSVLPEGLLFALKKTLKTQGFFKLRMMGLEPIRSHLRKILSLVRLPFRHIRLYRELFQLPNKKYITIDFLTWQVFFNFYQFFPMSKQSNVAK